jgi:hypothetical protein
MYRKQSEIDVREDGIWKKCTRCEEWKQLSKFFKKKAGIAGTRSICKHCEGITAEPRKLQVINGSTGKTCAKCEKWKPLNGYAKSKSGLGGVNSVCKDCRKDYRLSTRETQAEYQRNYKSENKEKINFHSLKRRTFRKNLPFDFTESQKNEIFRKFDSKCALSGRTDCIHWDHVIPLSTGHGGTIYGNMIPLQKYLNESKKDSNLFEWFETNRQRFNLSQEYFYKLITWLAEINNVSVDDYRDYVYWCHENPHSLEDLHDGEVI